MSKSFFKVFANFLEIKNSFATQIQMTHSFAKVFRPLIQYGVEGSNYNFDTFWLSHYKHT